MKRLRKLLPVRHKSKSPSATGSSFSVQAASAPLSTTPSHSPPAPFLTTATHPGSPLMSPAPLAEELRSSPAQTAWTNLKGVLVAVRDGSDLFLPLKAALVGVTAIMDLIDRVGDVNDEFVRIANNIQGFQGIFLQYGAEKDISPAMRNNLDAVTSEMKSIEEAISSKIERGLTRRTLEAPADVNKVVIAFKRLGNVIDRFQVNMGLHMEQGVQNITMSMSLDKLGGVEGASIDAQSPEGCLEGTCVNLLKDLQAWSCDPNSPQIFWLDGMAGTGKSAVARSFCHMLGKDERLGGSFFCLRGNANQGNPNRILPTLAVHLARQDIAYKWALLGSS